MGTNTLANIMNGVTQPLDKLCNNLRCLFCVTREKKWQAIIRLVAWLYSFQGLGAQKVKSK